ncbi:MFS transporter [Paucibacter sp. R3-3]|uniref:MFS transporter n=1 Tax=Roseateles agri TaxID=3098619 RepID=A0ABU5D9M5_9BURK|nr:MFS transporter [Paucibacter sp. R3-3]MDY0742969.1 MFS transporter [Paucibacter sp. R3-3]
MRLPNLLATRRGRLAAFFCLYMTEGMPLGFAATAVATQLRRLGVGPAEIGAFVASFYLPWAFKWAFGPFIDTFASERLGRRRGWVLGTQVMMALTLVSLIFVPLPAQLPLFTAILLVHNTFGAMQDVAIDSMACNVLPEDERGTANGLMFAGAYTGQAIGGSGVLFLSGITGFGPSYLVVAAAILLVTALVVLPMKEAVVGEARPKAGSLRAAGAEMRDFAVQSFRAFLGTRAAFSGLLYALLPAGAMCLGLALQTNLSVELGLNDNQVALMQLWSTLLSAAFCVAGGWLSDRFGRRRMLALFLALMSIPVALLALQMQSVGWIMPRAVGPGSAVAPAALIAGLWIATLSYNAFQGLMYGSNTAVFMDITRPAVAATQFTAYMALCNLAISYSAAWQGAAVEAWGYPVTMGIDAAFGLLGIALLPLMKRSGKTDDAFDDGRAAGRARMLAGVLALGCIGWLAAHAAGLDKNAAIAGTAFTLIFVASGLFLLAGAALLRGGRPWARIVMALLLLAMGLRQQLGLPEPLLLALPAMGAAMLARLAMRRWDELAVTTAAAA